MKRIMLSIDLGDNEVLEDSIREAIRTEAKRIAREQFSLVVQEEVKRIAAARAEEICRGHVYDGTIREIRAEVNSAVADHLKRNEFSWAYLEKKVDELFKKAQVEVDNRIDGLDAKVEAKISKIVRERFDKVFSDLLVRQLMSRNGGENDG